MISSMTEKKICFYTACMFSDCINNLEYLIKEFNINMNEELSSLGTVINDLKPGFKCILNVELNEKFNVFEIACFYNKNLSVFEYFFKIYYANNFSSEKLERTLTLVCRYNSNFDIICYLLKKFSYYQQNQNYFYNFLENKNNTLNVQQVKYLVEIIKLIPYFIQGDEISCLNKFIIKDIYYNIKSYLLNILTYDQLINQK